MWSRLREAVAGIAEQAGIEVPGLDSAGATDAAASAREAVTGVVGEATTTAGGLLDAFKGGLAP